MFEFLISALIVSVGINVICGWHLSRKAKKIPPQETYDVQALLTDLLRGSALVKVERVSPADVLLRSPRGRQ